MEQVDIVRLQTEMLQVKEEMASMRHDIRELLQLANQSKGGFWMGMALASGFGTLLGWFVSHWPFKG